MPGADGIVKDAVAVGPVPAEFLAESETEYLLPATADIIV